MKIQIIHRACGGTEFLPQPSRLHLGAQNAEGVDRLQFQLPESWANCAIALYLRRSDGTQLAPVPLDGDACVTVDRRLTGCTRWAVDAGRRERLRLHRLHPPRPVRHLCHPAHRRRLRGPAAHPVRAVRGPRAGKCQHSRHGGPERLGQRRTLHFQCRTGTDCCPAGQHQQHRGRPGVHPGPRLLPPAPKSWPRQTVRY